jgi:ABC-2 type transport system ATP-binding protein
MRQRLGIAAALIRDAHVILLDEPTSGLDPAGARAVAGLLRELAGQGVAVLVSSHLIGELEGLCDSYTVIRAGRVVWDGAAARVEREAPAAAYRLATTDDERALELAAGQPGVSAVRAAEGRGLRLSVEGDALAGFVLALGRAEVAVLRLEQVASPLESLFFALTGA